MNQNGIKLVQYCEFDGIRNLPDSYLTYLFERMVKENLVHKTFCDGKIKTSQDFVNMMKYGGNTLFLIFDNKELVGITWLNNFQGRSASIHSFLFQVGWGEKSSLIGKTIVADILNMKDGQGYILDVLIAVTSANNRLAVKWIKQSGMQIIGEIPNAAWDDQLQKPFPSVVSYAQREEKQEGESK